MTLRRFVSASLLVAAPALAHAQAAIPLSPFSFTISAGALLPTGDASKSYNTGYQVGAAVDLSIPLSPIGFRGEVNYGSLNAKPSGGFTGDTKDFGGNLNVVYGLMQPIPFAPKPYVTGGGSYSHISSSATSGSTTISASSNHYGFNLGGGVDWTLAGFGVRLDARYRQINGDGGSFKTIPITFGIKF